VRRADIQAAQALVSQNRAKMSYDEQQVAYGAIKSPINGLVAARETQPGQMATPGTALVRIVNVRTVYFQPTISDTDVNQVSVGMPVSVQVDGIPGKSFAGRVAAIYPAANTSNRLFTLRVNVDNPNNDLRPGMFARGAVTTQIVRNVPIVPTFALVPATSQSGFAANTSSTAIVSNGTELPSMTVVVVGPNNTAEIRPVTVGMINMQQAAITSGLNAGEQIVVEGQQTLKNGSKLIVEGQPGSEGGSGSRRSAHRH
jgi:RND family efflux transporter MFP subunit